MPENHKGLTFIEHLLCTRNFVEHFLSFALSLLCREGKQLFSEVMGYSHLFGV